MPRAKVVGKKNKQEKKRGATGSKASQASARKKTAPAEGGVKQERKQIRFRPGTVALREIKRFQKTTNLLLLRAPFQRLVRSICEGIDVQIRFQA